MINQPRTTVSPVSDRVRVRLEGSRTINAIEKKKMFSDRKTRAQIRRALPQERFLN